jgi:hypothetical protein
MKKLDVQPKNPRHFVALCFLALGRNPSLKDEEFLIQKVLHLGTKALFKSAYGYFWVNGENRKVFSLEFHQTKKEAIVFYKSLKFN